MKGCQHPAGERCRECAPFFHPMTAAGRRRIADSRRALASFARQTRSNGENGGGR